MTRLINNPVVFRFYSKSKDASPGKGVGEKIPEEERDGYNNLGNIKDWRKILSNFWKTEFEYDGLKWRTVEHYYQGSKYKEENWEYYYKFSVNSGSEWSESAEMAKGAGGKSGKYKGHRYRPKKMEVDKSFYGTNRWKTEMEQAQYEKFTQDETAKKVLKETKEAELLHIVGRGKPDMRFSYLMNIRKMI
tara:strand:+ start:1532 stop:2101 length:570 start_codon:yes stop_codon:yes gene_type:complete